MVIDRETLTHEALTLPPDQRMTLAYQLLASVEPEPTPAVEAAWEAEIQRRIASYRAGDSAPIPASEVFEMLEKIVP